MFPLYNLIAYFNYPHQTHWPRMVYLGDCYQLGPSSKSSGATPYRIIKTCSMMDRLVPEASPGLRGRNTIPTTLLNLQYRMMAPISELSNTISRRQVFTRMTRVRSWLRDPFPRPAFVYAGLTANINDDVLRHSVVWVDPYLDPQNRQDNRVQAAMLGCNHNYAERSPLEAIAIVDILRAFSALPGFRREHFMVLSSYNAQCALVRQCTREHVVHQIRGDNDNANLIDQNVCTVASAQGLECWLTIYTAGRGPLNDRRVGSAALIDSIRDLYVLSTRAKQHLVIVAHWDYMGRHCRCWAGAFRMINALQARQQTN